MKEPVPKPKKPIARGAKGELANEKACASIFLFSFAKIRCTTYSSPKKHRRRSICSIDSLTYRFEFRILRACSPFSHECGIGSCQNADARIAIWTPGNGRLPTKHRESLVPSAGGFWRYACNQSRVPRAAAIGR